MMDAFWIETAAVEKCSRDLLMKRICRRLLTSFLMVSVVGALMMGCKSQNRSIYQKLVDDGYTGTQEQWLASLVGEVVDGTNEKGAYELACENGYTAPETVWLETMIGTTVDIGQESVYSTACKNGFDGTLAEWLTEIAEDPEALGKSDGIGAKTEYELACEYGYKGSFIEWLVTLTHDRVF